MDWFKVVGMDAHGTLVSIKQNVDMRRCSSGVSNNAFKSIVWAFIAKANTLADFGVNAICAAHISITIVRRDITACNS